MNEASVYAKLKPDHLHRSAYIYIRQSTPGQVRNNTESAERQYALKQKALDLGWTESQIIIIDEDQAQSGASMEHRSGFRRLVADVGLGQVGAVLGLEVARLARSCSDWYRLLELCALARTIIIDIDGIYDLNDFNDRLLLGLKGTISEAELHFIMMRLQGGKQHKARKGELRWLPPVGLVMDEGGHITLDPNEEIQNLIRLVFAQFEETGSACQVMTYFRDHRIVFPRRFYGHDRNGELIWGPLSHGRVLQILHNPAYAGAYVYGLRSGRALHKPLEKRHVGTVKLPMTEWQVFIPQHHPGYITWEQFLRNQEKLRENQTNGEHRGAPREGVALAQGIAICGLCGRKMGTRYTGNGGYYVQYECNYQRRTYGGKTCQAVNGQVVDAALGSALLEAMQPANLAIALQVFEQRQEQIQRIEKQWQLRLQRARYEADRARRQFDRVEPEHRLVARTLETRWNEKLTELAQLEKEYTDWKDQPALIVTEEERQQIQRLSQDLPSLWNSPHTTSQDKKRLLRLLVKDVTLKNLNPEWKMLIQIRWQTDAVTTLQVDRLKPVYEVRKTSDHIIERIREMAADKTDRQIIEELNRQGLRSATQKPFTVSMIQYLRAKHQIGTQCPNWPCGAQPGEPRGDGLYSVRSVALRLAAPIWKVHEWIQAGLVTASHRCRKAAWWIKLDDETVKRLEEQIGKVRHKKPTGHV